MQIFPFHIGCLHVDCLASASAFFGWPPAGQHGGWRGGPFLLWVIGVCRTHRHWGLQDTLQAHCMHRKASTLYVMCASICLCWSAPSCFPAWCMSGMGRRRGRHCKASFCFCPWSCLCLQCACLCRALLACRFCPCHCYRYPYCHSYGIHMHVHCDCYCHWYGIDQIFNGS